MLKGEVMARDNGTVTLIYWKDKKLVKVITTLHDASMTTVQVRARGGAFVDVIKPEAVCQYNKYMSGVDRSDQMLSYYPTIRRTIKWF